MSAAPKPKPPKPPGFRYYMGGFAAIVTAIGGASGAGAIYLPKVLREAAFEAGETAAARVTEKISKDVIILQQRQEMISGTLVKIENNLSASLDFMAEQARIEGVVLKMVKSDALKK